MHLNNSEGKIVRFGTISPQIFSTPLTTVWTVWSCSVKHLYLSLRELIYPFSCIPIFLTNWVILLSTFTRNFHPFLNYAFMWALSNWPVYLYEFGRYVCPHKIGYMRINCQMSLFVCKELNTQEFTIKWAHLSALAVLWPVCLDWLTMDRSSFMGNWPICSHEIRILGSNWSKWACLLP